MSALRWDSDGHNWPNRDASRFVDAAGLRWHVQSRGDGPVLVLLHGTGASTHSWRDMIGPLAKCFTVIAPDLPGHGFTRGRIAGGPTLPGMARAVHGLLQALNAKPAIIVGHSAGAAIALQLAREERAPAVVGLSPALMPFPGVAARIFPAMAKLLFVNPFAPSIFARMVRSPGDVERFLARSTNSHIDAPGLQRYTQLLGNSEHCAGALAMMANWDLTTLKNALPTIRTPVLLAHGTQDSAIPMESVQEACTLVPQCELALFEGLGHLAHEEQPARAIELILRFAEKYAISAAPGTGG